MFAAVRESRHMPALRILLLSVASATVLMACLDDIALAQEGTAVKPQTVVGDDTANNGDATRREQIVVIGKAPDYRAKNATTIGPFGPMPLQDTPYSINVTPESLFENRNVHTESEALKTNPTVVPLAESNVYSSLSRVMVRGFPAADQDDLRDGMTDRSFTFPPIENVSRIEVLNGPTGFLYGFSEPGGTVNYVTKDPLPTPAADVSAGVYGGGIGYGELDAGGPIADKVDSRLILYKEHGSTYIDDGRQDRFLGAGVVNFQLAQNTSLKADFYHQDFDVDGLQEYFVPYSLNGAMQVPKAFDVSKQYGQPWTFNKSRKDLLGLRFQSELNDTFTVRAGYRYGTMSRSYQFVGALLTATPGLYNERYIISPKQFEYTNTAYALMDAHFDTGPVHHDFTFGFTGSGFLFLRGNDSPGTIIGSSNAEEPALFPVPVIPGYLDVLSRKSGQFLSNYLIGDQITFAPQWSALIGVNYAQIHAFGKTLAAGPQTLTPTSGNTYNYTQDQASPSASIIYKPISQLSLYGSYIQGLAAGGTAPDTFSFNNVTKAVTNSGDQLAPDVNNQYEVGAKGTFGDLYLTAALFRIEKVNEETDPSDFVYKKSGQEVHQGLELTATGKLTESLTVVGGLTWLQARIDQSKAIPADNGKIPFGVPEKEARLYLEYAIPGIQNLTVSFGANYFGKRPVDSLNTGYIPDVTTFDTGLRYEPELWGHRTSFDLTVSNLFDKSYWGSVSDYGEGLLLGSPRIVSFSTRFSF